jgi:hypothetical protein
MEIVTLAHVQLNRPGSASRRGFVGGRQPVAKIVEVRDGAVDTLRELVEAYAEERGEQRASLRAIQQVHWAYHVPNNPGAIVFNVQGPSTQYGDPYAVCLAYPALKAGGRYFKLEEVFFG